MLVDPANRDDAMPLDAARQLVATKNAVQASGKDACKQIWDFLELLIL